MANKERKRNSVKTSKIERQILINVLLSVRVKTLKDAEIMSLKYFSTLINSYAKHALKVVAVNMGYSKLFLILD